MSNRHYPRLMRERFHPIGKKELKLKCLVLGCREPVRSKVVVQYSWFRGEDGDPHYLCNTHGKKYNGANSIPNPFYVSDKDPLNA